MISYAITGTGRFHACDARSVLFPWLSSLFIEVLTVHILGEFRIKILVFLDPLKFGLTSPRWIPIIGLIWPPLARIRCKNTGFSLPSIRRLYICWFVWLLGFVTICTTYHQRSVWKAPCTSDHGLLGPPYFSRLLVRSLTFATSGRVQDFHRIASVHVGHRDYLINTLWALIDKKIGKWKIY